MLPTTLSIFDMLILGRSDAGIEFLLPGSDYKLFIKLGILLIGSHSAFSSIVSRRLEFLLSFLGVDF